jgi:ADP-heptose:LPS heptosyltransferase
MNHVKRIHGYNSPYKIACIKKGHECLFPTVKEFFYDWQDIPPNKKAGISRNPHEDELKERLRTKYGDIPFAYPQDTSWEEKTSLARFTFKPKSLHNRGLSADIVLAPRHRKIDAHRNYKNWQKLTNRLKKRGYIVAACGTKNESVSLIGAKKAWRHIDVDSDVEFINSAKVVITQDSGLAYLAMMCERPIILIGHCQRKVINAHRNKDVFIEYVSTSAGSPPVISKILEIIDAHDCNFPGS